MEGAFRLIERAAIAVAALAVLAAGAIIVASVGGRTFFGIGVPDAEIIVQDLMVLAVLLPLAAVAGRRAHIAVDLFVRGLSPRIQRFLNAGIGVLSILFLIPIAWSGWQNFAAAWHSDGYYDGALEIAEWPGRLAFLFGLLLFVARSIHRLFTDSRRAAETGEAGAESGH